MTTVYILGAGASAGYNGSYLHEHSPVARNFFEVACRVKDIHSCGARDFHDHAVNYRHFEDFIKKRFLTTMEHLSLVDLDMEDILTFLDLEIDNCKDACTLRELIAARRDFLTLMALTFEKVLYGTPCPHHGRIAAVLQPGDTVISFNYDLLMDSALDKHCPYWDLDDGYGVGSRMVYREEGFKVPPVEKQSEVFLLKLHGSFNWMICQTCGAFYTFARSSAYPESLVYRRQTPYPGMDEPEDHDLDWVIIPPTLKKEINSHIFGSIWTRAGCALERARKLVIIGYSLPTTDFYVKRLLHYSIARNSVLESVEIVDHNNKKEQNHILKKYLPIINRGKRDVPIICRHNNIAEYARSII